MHSTQAGSAAPTPELLLLLLLLPMMLLPYPAVTAAAVDAADLLSIPLLAPPLTCFLLCCRGGRGHKSASPDLDVLTKL